MTGQERLEKEEGLEPNLEYLNALLERAAKKDLPEKIFHWSSVNPFNIEKFDGTEWRGECDQQTWWTLYQELQQSVKQTELKASVDSAVKMIEQYQLRGQVPIAIGNFKYQTFKREALSKMLTKSPNTEQLTAAKVSQLRDDQLFEEKRAYFAGALIPEKFVEMNLMEPVHEGLNVKFIVPRELCRALTNDQRLPTNLLIDFDKEGERDLKEYEFDQEINVDYTDEEPKRVKLRLWYDKVFRDAVFLFKLRYPIAPPYDEIWDNDPVRDAVIWIYRGETDSVKHTTIKNPLIFACGYTGTTQTPLEGIWAFLAGYGEPYREYTEKNRFNYFMSELRKNGKDVLIVGYKDPSRGIKENAQCLIDCIEYLQGQYSPEKIVVGGWSMGGMLARYALLKMEHEGKDLSGISRYYSIDSAHNGAVISLGVQAVVQYYDTKFYNPILRYLKDFMTSKLAKELLWLYYDYEAGHSTGVRTQERQQLMQDLHEMGWFANVPKVAVANGVGDGTKIQTAVDENWPGIKATKRFLSHKMTLRITQHGLFDEDEVCYARYDEDEPLKVYSNSEFGLMDLYPAGTGFFFYYIAIPFGQILNRETSYSSYVPMVSAVGYRSANRQDEIYEDKILKGETPGLPIATLESDERWQCDFGKWDWDEGNFVCGGEFVTDKKSGEKKWKSYNMPHCMLNQDLADWLLSRVL